MIRIRYCGSNISIASPSIFVHPFNDRRAPRTGTRAGRDYPGEHLVLYTFHTPLCHALTRSEKLELMSVSLLLGAKMYLYLNQGAAILRSVKF
jgi:hypothetical protein